MRVLLQLELGPAKLGIRETSDPMRDAMKFVPKLRIDSRFTPVPFSSQVGFDLRAAINRADSRANASLLVSGWLPDDIASEMAAIMPERISRLIGVYSDPRIALGNVCIKSPAQGAEADAEALLRTDILRSMNMLGRGVSVAIVDSGVNAGYLAGRGRRSSVDESGSWIGPGGARPGQARVEHGTTSAFVAGIAAPQADLLDVAILHRYRGNLSAFLSDAVAAFAHLRGVIAAYPNTPLVINNSWALFDPSTDFPAGHRGNYSHNANHPFNLLIETIESEGADVVFAAGNCGPNCPDDRCTFPAGTETICGGNSHPSSLCVGAATVSGRTIDYSSLGPGALDPAKPDVLGPSHFFGSGVTAVDAGTSTAAPAVAGVIAAVRERHGPAAISPADLRKLISTTSRRAAATTGVIDVAALVAALP